MACLNSSTMKPGHSDGPRVSSLSSRLARELRWPEPAWGTRGPTARPRKGRWRGQHGRRAAVWGHEIIYFLLYFYPIIKPFRQYGKKIRILSIKLSNFIKFRSILSFPNKFLKILSNNIFCNFQNYLWKKDCQNIF